MILRYEGRGFFGAIYNSRPITSLTTRSRGASTAAHQDRDGNARYMFTDPILSSCRRRRPALNVERRL